MDDMQQLADTLAAQAVTDAEMGCAEGKVHSHLVGLMQHYGVTNPRGAGAARRRGRRRPEVHALRGSRP